MRIVINSSLKCPRPGLSLNEYMCKGPNALRDLWELLMRFRTYMYGLIGDVLKSYHSLRTGLLEVHLRRVVWRHGDRWGEWKVYGLQVVAFGDRQAAVLLQIVIRLTCEMYKDIDLIATQKI